MQPKLTMAITNILIILGFVAFIAALLPWILIGTTSNAIVATILAAVLWGLALTFGTASSARQRRAARSPATRSQVGETPEQRSSQSGTLPAQPPPPRGDSDSPGRHAPRD